MSALDGFRQELRALLGNTVLLRRDQTARALFISDAPRRLPNAARVRSQIEQAGFQITEENALWRIDLHPARRSACWPALPDAPLPQSLPLRALCRSLLSGEDLPLSRQPWPYIRLTLLRLDAGECESLYRELSAAVAVLKRTHAPLPRAAAYIIMEEMCSKEGSAC